MAALQRLDVLGGNDRGTLRESMFELTLVKPYQDAVRIWPLLPANMRRVVRVQYYTHTRQQVITRDTGISLTQSSLHVQDVERQTYLRHSQGPHRRGG